MSYQYLHFVHLSLFTGSIVDLFPLIVE